MKVTYLIEIELLTWRPYRILCLTKDYGAFTPTNREIPIQVTDTRTVHPKSFLYNALADEYLVRLWPISADNEGKGAVILKEFTGCGWEEIATHIGDSWLYLQRRWFVPESLKWGGPHGQGAMDALKETLREEADVRPESQAG